MRIIDLNQGTTEWLEWRSNGIGASDIAILMGENPHKTPMGLYNEKIGNTSSFTNDAMKHGNEQEPLARKWLESEYDVSLNSLCAQHDTYSFMRCSFDGINMGKRFCVEIKSPYSKEKIEQMKNEIPKMYYLQCQWQMMVCGFLDSMVLCIWDSEEKKGFNHVIEADEKVWEKMQEKASNFWNDLKRGIPPALTEKDYEDISFDHSELEKDILSYKEAKKAKSDAEKLIKEIEKKLDQAANDKNVIIHGVKMTVCAPRITYDISSMKAAGISVDDYKKCGKPYYKRTIM